VPARDGVMAARLKVAGCIVVGKTNLPEFGLGSHTFNELFGATPNAWDAAVSAGGSSGGAAVALARIAVAGAQVEPTALGFDAERLWRAWLVWRRALVSARIGALIGRPGARERIKPEALWEYDQGATLGFSEFMRASEVRTAFHARMLDLFERFDVLALPVTQVWPFPIGQRWPTHIAGREMDTYHRWMESTIYATFAGLPAISLPAGFHANGRWPAGLQLIGPPQADAALLRVAAAYETLIGDLLARRPEEPAA
jgi:amidase